MPDFNDLISQAKKMQEKMKETQEVLKKIEVEGISGGNLVKVILQNHSSFRKYQIIWKWNEYNIIKSELEVIRAFIITL